MIEIERKFLVVSDNFVEEATSIERIVQGFLNTDEERTVRVRKVGDMGYLTIKGKSNKAGTTRYEWEKEISVEEANELLEICLKPLIDKTRHKIPSGDYLFEVDVFHGENKGLIVAEVELNSENDAFEKPTWLGAEVTGDIKYYNSQLGKQPFKNWGL